MLNDADVEVESCEITDSKLYIKAITHKVQAEVKPGDVVTVADKSKENEALKSLMRPKNPKIGWVDFNEAELSGTFVAYPERENVPENIKEQLIVELYSK
jgi:ribosomal protein S4